jgi:MbtH protein
MENAGSVTRFVYGGAMMGRDVDDTFYTVVINEHDQYSIWPHDDDLGAGRREVGNTGFRPDCLAYIREIATDAHATLLYRYLNSHSPGETVVGSRRETARIRGVS